jgi:hypothetical protein
MKTFPWPSLHLFIIQTCVLLPTPIYHSTPVDVLTTRILATGRGPLERKLRPEGRWNITTGLYF